MEIINKGIANKISNLMKEAMQGNQIALDITTMNYADGLVDGFRDRWIDYKDIQGAFKVVKDNRTYYIFWVDWYLGVENPANEYYPIVVHVEDFNNALFSSYKYTKISETDEEKYLYWRYKPTKRDKKNNARKQLFKREYSDVIAYIKLPTKSNEVEIFINELLKIVDIRIKVENEVLDMN